jgi:peptidoglycan hydrolase CwlO-like protein
MKNNQKVITLVAMIFFGFALFGCGVSKDEHEKTVTELNKIKAELEQAKKKLSEFSGTGSSDAGIAEKLRAAQEKAGDLSEKLKTAALENTELKKKMGQMQSLIDQLKQKLKDLQDKAKGLSGDLLKR